MSLYGRGLLLAVEVLLVLELVLCEAVGELLVEEDWEGAAVD